MTYQISSKHQFFKSPRFFFLRIDELSKGYPSHIHDYVEIVIVLKGSALHLIDDKKYEITAGDVMLLQGMTSHGFEEASGDFRIANLMYLPDELSFPFHLLQKMPGYQALFVLEPARRIEGEFKSRLRLNAVSLKDLVSKIDQLKEEVELQRTGYESMIQARLLELIVNLSRAYTESETADTGRILCMGEAIAWMEEHYTKPISLPQLAKRAMLSERHFLRLFQKIFASSPIEHILRLRIRHASSLLMKGELSISEVAFASGFKDSNYFSRQFKKIKGVSPKQYARLEAARHSTQ